VSETTATPVLELERVTVRYGGVVAVRDLDLEVRRGEIVGLIGPNGAGKSTTLHAIMGAVPVDAGDVRVEGRSLRGRAPEAIARSGVALVPEGRRIFAELTVEENLRLGLSGRRTREGAEEAVEEVYGLFPVVREFGRRQAGGLSGGQQQQLAIGRALVAGPDVLLLDEPSLGLAPLMRDRIEEAIQQVHRTWGLTVILVEQDTAFAMDVADRVYVLDGGEVVRHGPVAEIAGDPAIRRAYLGVA
jgi:branched-chain amino acid transport system ATP-binding protein